MAAIVIGCFLVAAGVLAAEHRWLWGALLVWAGAIFASQWIRGGYDDGISVAYHGALIAALVIGPTAVGWLLGRLVRSARRDGPEWDVPADD